MKVKEDEDEDEDESRINFRMSLCPSKTLNFTENSLKDRIALPAFKSRF